jgi:site-specific recombinase XerD
MAREARRPIQERVDDFITSLESKGDKPTHVRSTRTYLERIVKLAKIERIVDLTPERIDLEADPPTATVLACYAKNGREAVQLLPSALAELLRPWIAAKRAGRPLFEGMTERTAEMLRVDLAAAGIPYETDSGVADFHALRVAYITHLVASGASVKTCQTSAHHRGGNAG